MPVVSLGLLLYITLEGDTLVKNAPSGARRERRQVRKAEIIEAAAKLFAEKGYHRTTTREIALAAGMAEGTLYNHFENKEDLLFQIVACLAGSFRLSQRLEDGFQDSPQEALFLLLRERIEWIRENRTMLQVVFSEILVNPLLRERYYKKVYLPSVKILEDHLESRQKSGHIRPIDIPFAARFLGGLSIGLFMLDSIGDEILNESWERMNQVMGAIIYNGIAPNST
jgi:AcrR family transcriptional regulator